MTLQNDPDAFLRELLIERLLGKADSADQLLDAARRGDYAAMSARFDNASHHELVALVSTVLERSLAIADAAVRKTVALTFEALKDIRDHGGSIDDVIAAFPFTEALGEES